MYHTTQCYKDRHCTQPHHAHYALAIEDGLTQGESGFPAMSERRLTELACIIEEFRTRPLTQQNYLALQRELNAAELMPEQLFCSREDEEAQRLGNRYMSYIVQSWEHLQRRGKWQ